MIEVKGRKLDAWGNVVFDKNGIIDLLMSGQDVNKDVMVTDDTDLQKFNALCKELDHPEDQLPIYCEPDYTPEAMDDALQSEWFIPESYKEMDILPWLLERCRNQEEIDRVNEEWVLFEDRELTPVLHLLIYLVDYFTENNIVWGVGRGSSVASFILYLIGIHQVHSIMYELDIREFIK